jgi:signal transduction histidine kinase/ActR/RegA family two-component response regulator
MSPLAATDSALIARARVDQVAMLYANWHRTTVSMLLGALILCTVMWGQVAPSLMAGWLALVLANQAWRGGLVHAWRRAQPGPAAADRWGRYWASGSSAAGARWGVAAIMMFPPSAAYQALLIVCLFGVVLGGLNLTAVYKPSFYGFVLPALVPLVVRVALEADPVHYYTAVVMSVVLGFVLAFGHRVNDILTHALATRYANLDLIAELKAQTCAALAARAAAEGANRGKTQLLAAASHDLRQPLHALALFAAALAAKVREAELRPLVSSIEAAVGALEAQFAQLLDLSRLEAGALAPEPARIPLGPLLARIGAEFAPQAAARGLSLKVVSTRLAVVSDPALLERMLQNLVANALRYTHRGGAVLGARRRGDTVSIDVVDSGVGIAPEHRDRIFEEFYQVPARPGAARAGHGMGLGLAIVRRFAGLLGHEVALSSAPGRGSRFSVRLPRAADQRSTTPVPGNLRRGRRSAATPLADAVIAVIDDDPAAVAGMHALFGTWGATVGGGSDAEDVLAALGVLESYPDLIVADLRLAGGDNGLNAVRRLRDELGVAVPALIVSADMSAAAAREVRAAGFALLPKPVVAPALQAAAAALIATAAPRAA